MIKAKCDEVKTLVARKIPTFFSRNFTRSMKLFPMRIIGN